MKDKFIKAMLEVCDSYEEIDEVFILANITSASKKIEFLKEDGVKYYDLPTDDSDRAEFLMQTYADPTSKHFRKTRKAKQLINELF